MQELLEADTEPFIHVVFEIQSATELPHRITHQWLLTLIHQGTLTDVSLTSSRAMCLLKLQTGFRRHLLGWFTAEAQVSLPKMMKHLFNTLLVGWSHGVIQPC